MPQKWQANKQSAKSLKLLSSWRRDEPVAGSSEDAIAASKRGKTHERSAEAIARRAEKAKLVRQFKVCMNTPVPDKIGKTHVRSNEPYKRRQSRRVKNYDSLSGVVKLQYNTVSRRLPREERSHRKDCRVLSYVWVHKPKVRVPDIVIKSLERIYSVDPIRVPVVKRNKTQKSELYTLMYLKKRPWVISFMKEGSFLKTARNSPDVQRRKANFNWQCTELLAQRYVDPFVNPLSEAEYAMLRKVVENYQLRDYKVPFMLSDNSEYGDPWSRRPRR